MFSPREAVKGHDRTYVRRMTTAEYLEEIQAEEADITGKPLSPAPATQTIKLQSTNVNQANAGIPGILKKRSAQEPVPLSKPPGYVWDFERRRDALTSPNPRVTFTSRYPTYDRLGHELSVICQFQDMTVQQELRRVAARDARTRRSGVRLSAELALDQTASRVLTIHSSRGTAVVSPRSRGAVGTDEGDRVPFERESSAGKSLVRPSHIHHVLPALCTRDDENAIDGADFGGDGVDVSVSEMTCTGGSASRASSYSSRAASRLDSARPSEFTIYRDSALARSNRRPQIPLKAASAPPAPCTVTAMDHGHEDEATSTSDGNVRMEAGVAVVDHRASRAPAVLLRTHSISPAPCTRRSLSGPPLGPPLVETTAPHPYFVVPSTGETEGEAATTVTAHAVALPFTAAATANGLPARRGRLPFAGRKRFASVSEPPPFSAHHAALTGSDGPEEEDHHHHHHYDGATAATEMTACLSAPVAVERPSGRPPMAPPVIAEDRGFRVSPVPLATHASRVGTPTPPPTTTTATATTAASSIPRESTAIRATKQLFRGTLFGSVGAGRGTTTVTHRQLIPGTAYGGPGATHIPASAVSAMVEANLEACAALSDNFFTSTDSHAPELQCGHVVGVSGGASGGDGRRWFRLLRFVVTADAYEAVEVEPIEPVRDEDRAVNEEEAEAKAAEQQQQEPTVAEKSAASDETHPAEVASEVPVQDCETQDDGHADNTVSALPEPPLAQAAAATATAAVGFRLKVSSAPSSLTENTATSSAAAAAVEEEEDASRFLLYRWRDSLLPGHGDEARRAALGLSLVAPEVQVSGYRYADGSGLTVLALPPQHRAVPIVSLPHPGPDSFLCCVKLLAKFLSCMVPRRTVHGNLEALAEVFLVAPVATSSPLTPDPATSVPAVAPPLLVVPVHWERMIDFGMFADRAAGRSIPYDPEDNKHGTEAQSHLRQGSDIQGVLQAVLEHKLASSLPTESYAALQRLLLMATQPAPMANLLVEISNLLASLPNHVDALHRTHNAAVNFYKRIYVE